MGDGEIDIPDEVVDLRLLLDCRRERDELQRRLEKWQRNETQFAANQQVARLIAERDEARAGVERLRELHETAVEQWTLESQNVKTLEEEVERKDDQLMAFSRQWADINTQNAALKNEVERLAKCCTQRGARMQIMRDWLDSGRGIGPPSEWWYFCEERPEARNWFDEDGVVV